MQIVKADFDSEEVPFVLVVVMAINTLFMDSVVGHFVSGSE